MPKEVEEAKEAMVAVQCQIISVKRRYRRNQMEVLWFKIVNNWKEEFTERRKKNIQRRSS